MMKIFIIMVLFPFSFSLVFASTQISYRVKTKINNKLELTLPPVTSLLSGWNRNNITFWWEAVPDIDRFKKEYLVIPSNGLVIPINTARNNLSSASWLSDWRDIDYNKYLETGALKFYSDTEYGAFGNTIIFGHSSFWKNKPWRYKTHFQKIIALDINEEIWIFKRLDDGNYKRYIYNTQKTYNTSPENIEILLNTRQTKKLTLFTCTPIWGVSWRRVIEAYYDENTARRNLWKETESLINSLIRKISSSQNKNKIIIRIFKKINKIRDSLEFEKSSKSTEYKLDILTILEEDLKNIYN